MSVASENKEGKLRNTWTLQAISRTAAQKEEAPR
jgi:hypothetical protein